MGLSGSDGGLDSIRSPPLASSSLCSISSSLSPRFLPPQVSAINRGRNLIYGMPPAEASQLLPPRHLESPSSSSSSSSSKAAAFIIPNSLIQNQSWWRPFPCAEKKMWVFPRTSQLFLFYCCCYLLSLPSPFHHGLVAVHAFSGTYGINYGRIADNIPPPESVVTLLKAAKIKSVRIYDADHNVLTAFKGSGLELVVGLGNEFIQDMSVNEERAMDWIKENVQPFLPDTHIRGIAVGNEVLGGANQDLSEALLGAIKSVYNSLNRLQLTDLIEVSTPHSEAVFANSYPPSACTFKEDVLVYMKPILDFFSQTGAPFYVNAYPFLAYITDPDHIDINYALFKSNPGVYDAKTDLHYDNMFDAQLDAAYAALETAGYEKMEVVVSETGWASSGDANEVGATVENARTYNSNLRKRLLKKKGTPFRPKVVVRAYIFALFNEDLKPGPSSERHFGLFKADGSIAYDIGFTGLRPSSSSSSLLSLKVIQARGWLTPYSFVLATCTAVLLALTT